MKCSSTKIILTSLLILFICVKVNAQLNFTVRMASAEVKNPQGDNVYGAVGVSYIQHPGSGAVFYGTKPVSCIWHGAPYTPIVENEPLNSIYYKVSAGEAVDGAIRIWFHASLYNPDGSKWGKLKFSPGSDVPKDWYIGKADKVSPRDLSTAYGLRDFDFIDVPLNVFSGTAREQVYHFICGSANKNIAFEVIFKNTTNYEQGLSPEAIHAAQAFKTLIQENNYVAENAGNINGTPFLSSNTNPQFGDGYCMGGTKNEAFFYNSLKQGKDNRTAIWGPIMDKWSKHNREHGDMGWPVSSVAAINDGGQFAFFQKGSIYYKKATGAHVVWGEIKNEFNRAGSENGFWGYPTSDERVLKTENGNGVIQNYEGATVFYKYDGGNRGAIAVSGKIWTKYLAAQGPSGKYGWPLMKVITVKNSAVQMFENGSINNE